MIRKCLPYEPYQNYYACLGKYVEFDEISLCSVVWKTPPPIEKEGRKVSIDYDEIFEVKVL